MKDEAETRLAKALIDKQYPDPTSYKANEVVRLSEAMDLTVNLNVQPDWYVVEQIIFGKSWDTYIKLQKF